MADGVINHVELLEDARPQSKSHNHWSAASSDPGRQRASSPLHLCFVRFLVIISTADVELRQGCDLWPLTFLWVQRQHGEQRSCGGAADDDDDDVWLDSTTPAVCLSFALIGRITCGFFPWLIVLLSSQDNTQEPIRLSIRKRSLFKKTFCYFDWKVLAKLCWVWSGMICCIDVASTSEVCEK